MKAFCRKMATPGQGSYKSVNNKKPNKCYYKTCTYIMNEKKNYNGLSTLYQAFRKLLDSILVISLVIGHFHTFIQHATRLCSIESNHFNLNWFWLMWLKCTNRMYFNHFRLKELKTLLYSWGQWAPDSNPFVC